MLALVFVPRNREVLQQVLPLKAIRAARSRCRYAVRAVDILQETGCARKEEFSTSLVLSWQIPRHLEKKDGKPGPVSAWPKTKTCSDWPQLQVHPGRAAGVSKQPQKKVEQKIRCSQKKCPPLNLLSKLLQTLEAMASATVATCSLPSLPEGWSAEKDFKPIGKISGATQRAIEPVGPHFLAHARRARHKRTFSEDDRIQAQERATKVEEDNDSDISEPEDPMMLQREAKDWKVRRKLPGHIRLSTNLALY